jgi:hypothetical protein
MKKKTNIILFSILGVLFLLYNVDLAILIHKYNQLPQTENTPTIWEEESVPESDCFQQDSLNENVNSISLKF